MDKYQHVNGRAIDELIKFRENIIVIYDSITDRDNKIYNLQQQLHKLEKTKENHEKEINQALDFKKSSFIKRLRYIKPNNKDLKTFTIISIINTILGILVGMAFAPFSLLFIGTFGYAVYLYSEEPIKKWKVLDSFDLERAEIKANWKDVKLLDIHRKIDIFKCEIEELYDEIEKQKEYFNQTYGITNIIISNKNYIYFDLATANSEKTIENTVKSIRK